MIPLTTILAFDDGKRIHVAKSWQTWTRNNVEYFREPDGAIVCVEHGDDAFYVFDQSVSAWRRTEYHAEQRNA